MSEEKYNLLIEELKKIRALGSPVSSIMIMGINSSDTSIQVLYDLNREERGLRPAKD